jgi:ATP-dependent Clp protease ATP-binding subunit ClpA
MFERFTERARQVVINAQDEARALRHNFIGTEHLLLGLLREEEGLAARVLTSFDGVTLEVVRAQVVRIVGLGDETLPGQIPFTPRAKKVLELGLREALSRGDDCIDTEHLLFGLAREDEGVAARILLDLDVTAELIRRELLRQLSPEKLKSPPERTGPIKITVSSHDYHDLGGFRDRLNSSIFRVPDSLSRLCNSLRPVGDAHSNYSSEVSSKDAKELIDLRERLEFLWPLCETPHCLIFTCDQLQKGL